MWQQSERLLAPKQNLENTKWCVFLGGERNLLQSDETDHTHLNAESDSDHGAFHSASRHNAAWQSDRKLVRKRLELRPQLGTLSILDADGWLQLNTHASHVCTKQLCGFTAQV